MIEETDILFLTKLHTLKLDKDDQFQDYLSITLSKGVEFDKISKIKYLQKVLRIWLMSKSNKEILKSLMELEILQDLVKCTKEGLEEWKN